jgi:predicted RNA-binding Zn ribbon-like protein
MRATVEPPVVTGQIHFDSHVEVVTDVACRLVNTLTPGHDGVAPVEPETATPAVVRELLERSDYHPRVTRRDVIELIELAARVRTVFVSANDDDLTTAVGVVNELLEETAARPRLDQAAGGGWTLHFHGRDPSLVVGWGAGIAVGLALAIGSDLAGRLGVCAAEPCDRVYVDTSRNSGRRFCSTRCQNRMKAAAHRLRR